MREINDLTNYDQPGAISHFDLINMVEDFRPKFPSLEKELTALVKKP